MATRVSHDALNGSWEMICVHERDTGRMPLPAVDTIQFAPDRHPSMVLVAPESVSAHVHVFVDVERMPAPDKVSVYALLTELGDLVNGIGDVESVLHSGGLDYVIQGAHGAVQLSDLSPERWARIWGVLHAVASLSVRSIDEKATEPPQITT